MNCGCEVICLLNSLDISGDIQLRRFNANPFRDLVDQNRKGKLTRDEFVVGMWLIDQSLRGRKLPIMAIPLEVWQSSHRLTTFLRH